MSKAKNEKRYDGCVAVWLSTHYAYDPRDWNNIREFGGQYHPLAGYYKSNDLGVLRRQLHEMRRAGVDLIVLDNYATNKGSLENIHKDPSLGILVDELASQKDEPRKLKLCMWVERYYSVPSLAEYEFALDYIRKNLAEEEYYFRYKGKPLLLAYLGGFSPAIDEIEYRNTYFTFRRIRPFESDVWAYVNHYPQMLRKEWMPASPGFDAYLEEAYVAKYVKGQESPDYEEIRRNTPRAEREDGQYFRKQLEWAKKANPDIICISTWNDWQYANQIEPAVEYEYLYVDLAAEVLGRRAETAPYR